MKNLLILYIGFSLIEACSLHAQSPNSDLDPQLTEVTKWESAEMPVPFGIIVSSSNPFYNAIEEIKGFETMSYDFIFYYDTWQAGWAHKEYGDALMLMARTFGRDDYGSLYFEFGNSMEFQTKDKLDSGVASDEFGNFPFYGLGIRGQGGFDKSIRFSMFWDLSFGVLDMDESPKYFSAEFGVGLRLPISITAVYLHLSGFYNRGPDVDFPITENIMYDDNDWRYRENVGLKLRMSFALNFQH